MKKISLMLNAVVMTSIMLSSCGKVEYNEVTIGKQVWMSENLSVDKFRNGDPIPEAKTDEEWVRAGKNGEPAWCYYENDPINGKKYGKLYNWYAVNDPRGFAPIGWKVPSNEEWYELTDYLGGTGIGGTKMKSTNGWEGDGSGIDGNGTNESEFSALPGGARTGTGVFANIGDEGAWWSSSESEYGTDVVWIRLLGYHNGIVYNDQISKEKGISVRCLRD